MPFHRKILRKIIPKEIREPISRFTESIEDKVLDPISDVTEKLEDAVRPVTDPIRKFVSKAIPKELKPLLRTGIAVAGASGGPLTAFLTSAAYDAYLQKLMTDPDAADTDVDFLAALQSGLGGAIKATAALPMAEPTTVSANVPFADPQLTTGDTLKNIAIKGAQEAAPFLTAPTMDTFAGSLTEGLKQTGKLATGLSTLQTPTIVRDTMQAIEDQEDALAASEAATKADYDALQKQRVASMLGSFERAGFEPEETQREIEEEGLTVSLEEVQDYFNKVRQFVAKGGRIGFQDGTQEGPMTMGMGIGKYIEEERIRRNA